MSYDWPVTCPHCAAPLSAHRRHTRVIGLDCPSGHHFTAAKQGYVNLLVGRGTPFTPDTSEMIMARERVLSTGLFDHLGIRLGEVLQKHHPAPRLILDAGAGTGYHLGTLLATMPETRGLALDLSPAGLRRAAKLPRTLALGWDLWRPLPLRDSCLDVVLTVFAPRNPHEYARVLSPGGIAIVVTPRPRHLAELADAGLITQQEDKHEHLLTQMAPHLGPPAVHQTVTSTVPIEDDHAADLVLMGPAGHHRQRTEVLPAVEQQELWSVTTDLDVTVWRR